VDAGLEPATTYTYRVSARDAARNESGQSDPAQATTGSAIPPSCSDVGSVCPDGTVLAGTSPIDGAALYVTRCDQGQSWNGSACAGTRAQLAWSSALSVCGGLSSGGQSDFVLPPVADLLVLYASRSAIGGFRTNGPFPYDPYWSATEHNSNHAVRVRFADGTSRHSAKTKEYNVRCIRRAQ